MDLFQPRKIKERIPRLKPFSSLKGTYGIEIDEFLSQAWIVEIGLSFEEAKEKYKQYQYDCDAYTMCNIISFSEIERKLFLYSKDNFYHLGIFLD